MSMRRFPAALALATTLVLGAPAAAHGAVPPAEFGTDWDDPRTAGPPVDRPGTASCTVPIVDHGFADFNTYLNTFTPPAACPGPWSKVVLHLDRAAAVGGVRDRLGRRVRGVLVHDGAGRVGLLVSRGPRAVPRGPGAPRRPARRDRRALPARLHRRLVEPLSLVRAARPARVRHPADHLRPVALRGPAYRRRAAPGG